MSLAEDLLLQARRLASFDEGIPSQASLRRAVSSAYYALFHLLIADASVSLQDERHRADYDLAALFDRSSTFEYVTVAEDAFANWRNVRDADEANVFLSALLLYGRWSK